MTDTVDTFAQFKQLQKRAWSSFAPLEAATMTAAAKLVRHARVRPGDRILDVACGTGVVAMSAASVGAKAVGLDLTPELLARARDHSKLASHDIEWHEGDAEAMPFEDKSFDVVLSQFGHIFAPRADVVTREMLRVLRPGGTLAFSTWPPELYVGSLFQITSKHMPPAPPGVTPPFAWGETQFIRDQLGDSVREFVFDRDTMMGSALSPAHHRAVIERTAGPLMRVVQELGSTDPEALNTFRNEIDTLTAQYWSDNQVRQGYLMTRAIKKSA